nr:lysylphosphatidylglycerol synthase domain-containing protein [Rhabdothermincola salaria]
MVSLTVVAVFFTFVIPAVSDAHYSEIWRELDRLTWLQVAGLTAVWITSMLLYTGVLTTSLPGLTHPQALTVNFAGSAVSNVVPFGGAVGVGATYAICLSWGFRMTSITLSILVSGIWNVFAKLGLPLVALALLVGMGLSSGHTRSLLVPTVLGLAVLVAAVTVLVLILRSEPLAVRIGELGQRLATPVARRLRRSSAPDVAVAVVEFRHRSIGLLRTRWLPLTLWMLAYNLTQYLLLLGCVRAIGVDNAELGWAQVFAAFAFARLLETIPLTPSGVGFVEAGAVAALIGFGGGAAGSTAAVFCFRGFTYLAEIPLGAVGWLTWTTRRSWRRPPRSRTETPEAVGAPGP